MPDVAVVAIAAAAGIEELLERAHIVPQRSPPWLSLDPPINDLVDHRIE